MSSPTVWAVLIGLDFYIDPSNRLRGAVNDIEDMELSLNDAYDRIRVTKLTAATTGDPNQMQPPGSDSSWPTWDNITRELRHVTTKASPNDVVYIHYSGHGTLLRVTERDGYKENYGLDAALVLFEPQGKERIRYFRGIELAELLDSLVKRELNVTMVLDSCHSGSISRGNQVRGIPWNEEVASEFPIKLPITGSTLSSSASYFRDAALKSQWLLSPRGYNLIAACEPHETAKELELAGDRFNGALSYHILEALAYFSKMKIESLTYGLIKRRICAKMYERIDAQHPILIGNEAHMFLGTKVVIKATSASCEVVRILSQNMVSINVGRLQGVDIGDEYDIEIKLPNINLTQRVIVRDVGTVDSTAEFSLRIGAQDTSSLVRTGLSAVLVRSARPKAYVKLPEREEPEWSDLLHDSLWLENSNNSKLIHAEIPILSVILVAGTRYEVVDSNNKHIPYLPLIETSELGARRKILTILEHLAKFMYVLKFDNVMPNCLPSSDFVITAHEKENDTNVMHESCIEVTNGKKVQIAFENLSSRVLYLTVLNLTPLREIKRLYPKEREYQTVLPHDGRGVLPKVLPSIRSLPGKVTFAPRANVPNRIKEHGGSNAEDILKFFVGTKPINRTSYMNLPDLWKQIITDNSDPNDLKISQEGSDFGGGSVISKRDNEHPWTCKSIVIRSVAE